MFKELHKMEENQLLKLLEIVIWKGSGWVIEKNMLS